MIKKILLKKLLPFILEIVRVDVADIKEELPKRNFVILRKEFKPFGFIQVYLSL